MDVIVMKFPLSRMFVNYNLFKDGWRGKFEKWVFARGIKSK